MDLVVCLWFFLANIVSLYSFWNNLGSFFAYSVDFFCILLYHNEQIVVEGLDCAL